MPWPVVTSIGVSGYQRRDAAERRAERRRPSHDHRDAGLARAAVPPGTWPGPLRRSVELDPSTTTRPCRPPLAASSTATGAPSGIAPPIGAVAAASCVAERGVQAVLRVGFGQPAEDEPEQHQPRTDHGEAAERPGKHPHPDRDVRALRDRQCGRPDPAQALHVKPALHNGGHGARLPRGRMRNAATKKPATRATPRTPGRTIAETFDCNAGVRAATALALDNDTDDGCVDVLGSATRTNCPTSMIDSSAWTRGRRCRRPPRPDQAARSTASGTGEARSTNRSVWAMTRSSRWGATAARYSREAAGRRPARARRRRLGRCTPAMPASPLACVIGR